MIRGHKRRKNIFFQMQSVTLFALLLCCWATPAMAAATVGDIINNVVGQTINLPTFVNMFAYLAGCFFAIIAIFKFKDCVDNPQQTPISVGMKYFFAGGMLLSLAFMAAVSQSTLFGVGYTIGSGAGGVQAGSELGVPVGVVGSLDAMIVSFVRNIAIPMQDLFSLFAYISACIFLVIAITRLTKRMEDGPRGPAGLGTLSCFLVAGALFSLGDFAGAFLNSLFGDTNILTVPTIGVALGMSAADQARVGQALQGLMYFVGLVGMIGFMRGIFVFRAFADGRQDATLPQALTFIIGGALCMNMGRLVNVLQTTVG